MVILVSILTSLLALFVAGRWASSFMGTHVSNDKVRELSLIIRSSAKTYLAREYRVISYVAAFVFLVLFIFLGWKIAVGFLVGAVASALAGYIGMIVAVHANAITAEAAKDSEKKAFLVSFKGGAVTGLMVAGLALFVISLLYFLVGDIEILIGLGFGGSLLSVFARIGGGIFTKAADVGADLVGKVEVGIPEDDPRNPAVIADNVGDNVGDVAGMAADIFETYIISALSVMLLGSLVFPSFEGALLFPLAIGAVGIVSTLLSIFFVKLIPYKGVMRSLYSAVGVSVLLSSIFLFPVALFIINGSIQYSFVSVYFAVLIGFFLTGGIFVVTDYYTSKNFSPVKRIARASTAGHGPNVIIGLAVGFEATVLPVILIGLGIIASFWLAGIYGIALAVMGMLSLAGIIVTLDAFGPISDNAGGIAEMAGLPEETRRVTDILDSAGNTTKAITKGYAIASAALAALVLFAAYKNELSSIVGKNVWFSLSEPAVIIGLFLGGAISYLFVSLLMSSVGKAAGAVVEEVRRQFKEIPGLREGKAKPNYERTV